MPDSRRHRGPHPEDARAFAKAALPRLRTATHELSWLYERGYKPVSSLKLVGDRHALIERQRAAVARCACAESLANKRRARSQPPGALRGAKLRLDGFNVLTTLEVALSGGVVLLGRDGALRDIAGVHGSYRRVAETLPALALVSRYLQASGVARCEWLLDQPVSNSGRLCTVMRAHAAEHGLAWTVDLVHDPDRELACSDTLVASADGTVLDEAAASFQLTRAVVEQHVPDAWLIDLSGATS
ncbi:MAG: DUF434 domain-containing protein [Polyangiales bacterium]